MSVDLCRTTIDRFLRSDDVDGAASYLESLLRVTKTDRFASLADQRFVTPPGLVLDHINAFITACRAQFDVKSVYLEMNGFDINYGCWYFDSFGYSKYVQDPDNLEWLCDWESPDWKQLTLTGLEQTQDDFRWYVETNIWEDKTNRAAEELAVLLVMCALSN